MDDRPDWFEALADRYRVEKEIGRGGMARVYLAEDLRFHRKVAIKVLREELALALAEDRFVEEIRLAARLNHPNIVPLYDAGVIPAAGGRPALPWFAMMYIAGETLRERLARGPLPVGAAVDVARAVAAALDYAHEMKVIHRDIKPANILLAGDVPVVADFGIARALDRAGGVDTLTAPGLAVGTVQYISPEQAGSEPTLDHRTDVYSLGCVVYEMLAGHPPFTGPTAQAIIARHNLDVPPPLATVRPSVPPAAVAAVEKALAKKPPDRWPSAGAFAHALRETMEHSVPAPMRPIGPPRRWTRPRTRAMGLTVMAVLAGVGYLLTGGPGRGAAEPLPDTTRFVVLPFQYQDAGLPSLQEDQVLAEALGRWTPVTVEEPLRVRERLASGGQGLPPDGEQALRLARDLGAGRYVAGTVARMGDSLRVFGALFDVKTRRELRTHAISMSASPGLHASALAAMADSLLLPAWLEARAGGASPGRGASLGTRSLPSLQAWARGSAALEAWDPDAADSAFTRALEFDRGFPQAALWLALIRSWQGRPVTEWAWAVQLAGVGRIPISGRDSALLAALEARAAGDLSSACLIWDRITREHPQEFVGWYGAGECRLADNAVVAAPGSPWRWRFRSSYDAAIRNFRQAFVRHPAVHRSLRGATYPSVRRLLLTSGVNYRDGRAATPQGRREFFGVPTLSADTIAVVPIAVDRLAAGTPLTPELKRAHRAAVGHLRRVFYDIARGWAAAFPRSPEALESLAHGMALIGYPTAADTIARARRLAADPRHALELASQEAWLRLELGLAGDPRQLRSAAAIAESLLADPDFDRLAPELAASLAALTGRTGRLVQIVGTGALDPRWSPPPALRPIGPILWAYSASGTNPDSADAYARLVSRAIERAIVPPERGNAAKDWLGRAAAVAYPEHILLHDPVRFDPDWYLLRAIAAHGRGDLVSLRRALAEHPRDPGDPESLEITPDLLPAEAALRWQAGDSTAALAMLDANLAGLGRLGLTHLSDPVTAAGLMRAIILHAALVARRGGPGGGVSRQAVALLWAGDPREAETLIRRYQALLE